MTPSDSPATPPSPFGALAPLRLPVDLRLTPEHFELVMRLPDGSVLSPDASLRRLERWQAGPHSRATPWFRPPLPRSGGGAGQCQRRRLPWCERPALQEERLPSQQPARLGWLLLPHKRAVVTWPASGESKRIEQAEVLEGGPEFPGLRLQLGEIWDV